MAKELKPIEHYLPKSFEEKVKIQADIPDSVFKKATHHRLYDKLSWNKLITALLERYIDERKK